MITTIGSVGAALNLRIRQGGSFLFSVALKNPDGSPVNLTGATLSAQIRRKALDANPPVAACVIAVTDAVNGLADLSLTDEVTAAIACGEVETLPASRYVWDLELLDTLGRVTPLLYGDVVVFREVTRV